jgi:glycosyltransferase involved in cell wall biosynthesis
MHAVTAQSRRAVDVIVRVDHDGEALVQCLEGLFGSRNDTPFDVIVCPASLESDAHEALRGTPHAGRVSVAGRGEPLSRILARHRDRDVVLLAADACVHGNWLDRLAHHASVGVAAVGVLSNVGGLGGYPRAGAANAIPPGETAAFLDALAAQTNERRAVDADALDGPCIFVTRAALDSLGETPLGDDEASVARALSSAIAAAGLHARIAGDLFIARRDGARASPTDAARNPALALARRLDVARLAASPRPSIVFVSHAWGGGIRRHMNDLAALISPQADVLYLEPAGDDLVRLGWPRDGETFAAWFRLPQETAELAAMLRAIGVARLHFHHVHGLPQAILALPREADVPYDCTLHDYFAICPQYHLADERGRYCGEPDRDGCATCMAHRHPQWPLDIGAWRALFDDFLHRADRIIAPSRDVATRIHRYFPDLSILVWPHAEAKAFVPPAPFRIVTLGNLSAEKGLDVVAACARDAQARNLPLAFRLLGAIAHAVPQWPEAPLSVHGSYADDALPALLAAERPDALFFPAQVPETYAYTLSVALATDVPIVASALGAFPERLAGRPRVRLLPFDAEPVRWNDALLAVVREKGVHDVAARVDAPLHAAP